jgi:hypothetical protein
MRERDTHRTNSEARADVAARRAGVAGETTMIRYLAAAAYREARHETEAAENPDEEDTDEHPASTGEPGAEYR